MSYASFKSTCYRIIQKDDDSFGSKFFDLLIIAIIVINVLALTLETVESIEEAYSVIFYRIEVISLIIFSIEYLLRVWVITEEQEYRHPIKGRLKYMVSFTALLDLLVVLPFYLPFLLNVDMRILRVFRVFRLFRIFGLSRYSASADLINTVIHNRRTELVFSFVIIVKLLFVASSLMYYVEHTHQPELFSSIPAAMWWGIATLTTVGYGDMVPITVLGKVVGGVMAILGIGLFALPAGIFANGFSEEIKKRKLEKRVTKKGSGFPKSSPKKCPHCDKEL